MRTSLLVAVLTASTHTAGAIATKEDQTNKRDSYSPQVGTDVPMQVLWGDTHLHTSFSVDAFFMENQSLTPENAYRFARGKSVTATNGMVAKLNRPLDFLVVSDHSEYLGLLPALAEHEPAALELEPGRRWANALAAGGRAMWDVTIEILGSFLQAQQLAPTNDIELSTWELANRFAEAANEPGVFSAFAGFEWSSMPGGDNLHRVVLFRDGAEKTTQVSPFTAFDSLDPEDLWRYLEEYEQLTGGKAMAIPHNGNQSNGLMFTATAHDKPIDREYAERRARWEPIVEVTQIKGDGETHPLLSPNDEFADYGTWDKINLTSQPKEPWMLEFEYARSALRLGLKLEENTGINPYRFGMIGSTDSHTGLATAEEDNFWGKSGLHDPSHERAKQPFYESSDVAVSPVQGWEQVAAGYAAVWATENTREAIFDAMQRREVYATTGPRITVRFFGGWQYDKNDITRHEYAMIGYEKGVPMGSVLPHAPDDDSTPHFMIMAQKDPMGANIDRVQVVKGWLDSDGQTHERVYDVVWAGDRQKRDGKLLPVGNTVDPETATYQNTIGAIQLTTLWTDPDFAPGQRAFYYLRVLEIPTPRWVLYDKARLGAEIPEDAELTHQERAYTSPIWYDPKQQGTVCCD